MANISIELQLKDIKPTLTKTEKTIADYIEVHLESIAKQSIKELSEQINTSEASIVRFCKTLGFKGYRDFAIKLSEEIGSKKNSDSKNEYTDIRPGDNISTIIENVCFNNSKAIYDTKSVLNSEDLSKLIKIIEKADRIFFFGIGASGLVCMDASKKYMKKKKKTWALTDSHSMQLSSSLLSPKDIAIFLSYSGTTPEIISAFKTAKKTGAKTASISKYAKGNISSMTDIALYISSPEVTIRSGAMSSRIAMLNVIDIIFSCIASDEYNEIKKYLDDTHDAVRNSEALS